MKNQGFLTKTDAGYLELRYNDFIAYIVKAVQELSTKNDTLERENQSLHEKNIELEKRLDAIESHLGM
jgi:FtsZ-binding cell division protein ZapB